MTETLVERGVVELAVVDGTTWALVDSGGDMWLAFSSGGAWTVEPIGDVWESGRMAVAADGTVYVVYGGGGGSASGVMSGLVLARRSSSGQWTYRLVSPAASRYPEYVDIALVGGEPWIAWHDKNVGSLKLSMASAGAFTTETIDDDVDPVVQHDLSLAVDAQGRAHVAYRLNSAFLREIHYAVRDGGTWSRETVAVLRNGIDGDVRIALSPAGGVAVAYVDSQGVGLATRDGGSARWFTQPLLYDAHAVDLAFDAAGVMHVALATRAADVRLFSRAGSYAPDYDTTCDEIAQTLCPLACACGPNCCISSTPGNESCASPLGYCEYAVDWMACGDASQDPQISYACHAAASTATCSAGGGVLQVPDACAQI
jgi:hypothetical protein